MELSWLKIVWLWGMTQLAHHIFHLPWANCQFLMSALKILKFNTVCCSDYLIKYSLWCLRPSTISSCDCPHSNVPSKYLYSKSLLWVIYYENWCMRIFLDSKTKQGTAFPNIRHWLLLPVAMVQYIHYCRLLPLEALYFRQMQRAHQKSHVLNAALWFTIIACRVAEQTKLKDIRLPLCWKALS